MQYTSKNSPSAGFTLVEILAIAPIVILAIGAFIALIVTMTGEVLTTRATNTLTYDIESTFSQIRRDAYLSDRFWAENSFSLTANQFRNDTSGNFTNSHSADGDSLILSAFATSANPASNSYELVPYAGQPNPCGDTASENNAVMLNIVYFVKDDTLWRRVLAPSDYQSNSCGAVWQRPSCAAGSVNGFCTAEDVRMIDGVTVDDFSVRYYTDASQPIEDFDTTPSDPAQPTAARNTALASTTSARIVVTANQVAAGRDITRAGSLRITVPPR